MLSLSNEIWKPSATLSVRKKVGHNLVVTKISLRFNPNSAQASRIPRPTSSSLPYFYVYQYIFFRGKNKHYLRQMQCQCGDNQLELQF